MVLTHDLDFGDILAASGELGPSVALIRADDLGTTTLIDKVIPALAAAGEALERGALVSIDTRRSRVRLLPLKRAV